MGRCNWKDSAEHSGKGQSCTTDGYRGLISPLQLLQLLNSTACPLIHEFV